MNFYENRHGIFPQSFYNQHVVNFQSSNNFQFLEQLPGLKHDTGLSVDWSFNEQAILNDGLVKYAEEQGMMKYVKIAASLPDKTVRDVALRCRWMAKENVKRRRIQENFASKKFQNRKDMMVDTSMQGNFNSVALDNNAAYSFLLHNSNQNNRHSYNVPVVDGATQLLLDENVQVLNQISDNLSTCNLQDNVELFSRTNNNIVAILNSMSQTPGIMSHMNPLPVSIDHDLMSTILPIPTQEQIYMTQTGTSMKHEPI